MRIATEQREEPNHDLSPGAAGLSCNPTPPSSTNGDGEEDTSSSLRNFRYQANSLEDLVILLKQHLHNAQPSKLQKSRKAPLSKHEWNRLYEDAVEADETIKNKDEIRANRKRARDSNPQLLSPTSVNGIQPPTPNDTTSGDISDKTSKRQKAQPPSTSRRTLEENYMKGFFESGDEKVEELMSRVRNARSILQLLDAIFILSPDKAGPEKLAETKDRYKETLTALAQQTLVPRRFTMNDIISDKVVNEIELFC